MKQTPVKQKPSILIRPYQPDDLSQIMQLFKDTVHAINKKDYNPAQLQAWAPDELDKSKWATSLLEHISYVAVLNQKIVGFADMSKDGYLDRLYVHKDYQGRFISKRLIISLYQEALKRGLNEISANVSITAMPLAERAGFELIKQQEIEHRGQRFINYHMVMKIKPNSKFKLSNRKVK